MKTLRYLYVYGDGWKHTINIERMTPPEDDVPYPRLIEASGRCPPDDVGGPRGYGEMLEALEDPGHERHDLGVAGARLRSARLRRRPPQSRRRYPRHALGRENHRQEAETRLTRGPHGSVTSKAAHDPAHSADLRARQSALEIEGTSVWILHRADAEVQPLALL